MSNILDRLNIPYPKHAPKIRVHQNVWIGIGIAVVVGIIIYCGVMWAVEVHRDDVAKLNAAAIAHHYTPGTQALCWNPNDNATGYEDCTIVSNRSDWKEYIVAVGGNNVSLSPIHIEPKGTYTGKAE